jgi:hypothetical protein
LHSHHFIGDVIGFDFGSVIRPADRQIRIFCFAARASAAAGAGGFALDWEGGRSGGIENRRIFFNTPAAGEKISRVMFCRLRCGSKCSQFSSPWNPEISESAYFRTRIPGVKRLKIRYRNSIAKLLERGCESN